MNRKITILTLFLWLMTVSFPVIAQQKADTTYTFRSVPQKDMFYVPWIGNDTELSLRANLLRWATLTPDLGVEWRICPSWGIAVNSSWTSWSWNDKDRRYALWEVAPEVRLTFPDFSRHFFTL